MASTNERKTGSEQPLSITTDAADTVRMTPDNRVDIAPGASITTGHPGGANPAALDVTLQGMRKKLTPGMSVDVTFTFDKSGPIQIRTPVEACPRESTP